MSTFTAIQTALSGLIAHQRALEVTGHNVTNVNTPGYHRQEAILQAGVAQPAPGGLSGPQGGQFGSGVEVLEVRRLQNTYLQQQIRLVESQFGRWNMAQSSLQQIQSLIAPGEDLDLSAMLDRFFGAWQTLATHPEEEVSRLTVRSEGVNLTNTLNELVDQMDYMSDQLDLNLESRVERVNLLVDNLATLNSQIGMAKAEGREPNDLLDQREVVLTELTTITGVSSFSNDEISSIVNLGGRALVQGTVGHHLQVVAGPTGKQVVWADDGEVANLQSGEIAGLFEIRDTVIPSYKAQLDGIAFALSSAVNNLHSTGVTMTDTPAGNFFTGTTAGSIKVSDAILTDARNIAATRTVGAVGDGALASDIFKQYGSLLVGNQTLNQSAQSLIGQIGNAVKTAATNVSATKALRDQLDTQQQTTSGVSLDEEMANLLTFQRSYDAAARVLTASDEMIRTVLERMGS